MRFVNKITSSLKGGVSVEIGHKTVLVGPNGAGKTAVIQALELATKGWVTDVEGREKVSAGKVIGRLFPEGERRVARAEWTDGAVFLWEMEEKAGEGYKSATTEQPFTVTFPVQDLIETFRSNEATIKSWIENQTTGNVVLEDILREVGSQYKDVVEILFAKTDARDFLSLAEAAKSRARALRTLATQSEKTVERVTQGATTPLLTSDRQALEEKLEALKSSPVEGVTKEQHQVASRRIKELKEDYLALPEVDPDLAERAQRVRKAQELLTEHSAHFGDSSCVICGGTIDNLKARIEEVDVALSHMKEQTSIRMREEAILHEIGLLDHVLMQPVATPSAERDDLTAALAKDDEARKVWDNATSERTKISILRQRATAFSDCATTLDKAGRRILDSRKVAFEDKASAYLNGDRLGVDLEASRIGLVRDEEIHTAISGAEESRLLLAVGATDSGSDLILIPRDRSWDPKTLAQTMKGLQNCPHQILIMSTVHPEETPDGWTLAQISR